MNDPMPDSPTGRVADEGAAARYLAFNHGKRECLIPADEVSEILSSLSVSRVPGSGPAVRGIAIHRGEIVTVVELAELMPDQFRARETGNKFLVLGNGSPASQLAIPVGETLGFIHTPLPGGQDDKPRINIRLGQIRKLLDPQDPT